MSYGKHNSAEIWLKRNLNDTELSPWSSLLDAPVGHIRNRVLRTTLALATVVIAAMWYQEERLGLINLIDRIGYPMMFVVAAGGTLLLRSRPESLKLVLALVFFVNGAHLLGNYYLEMWTRISSGTLSDYEFAIMSLWLPLGYVGSFVFLSPKVALYTSIGIYTAIATPQLAVLALISNQAEQQLAIAIILSQPIYIVAMWGVGLLKLHASGIHDMAKSMRVAASLDALTGIANRRALFQAMESVIESDKANRRVLGLLFIDVDNFKRVNDSYGHNVGDEVLVRLANEVGGKLRSTDLLGRWGGEEFMVATIDQDEEIMLQVAERLREHIEQVGFPQVGRVTVSIGVTRYIQGESLDSFINRADDALYNAKQRGRNRVETSFGGDRVTIV